MLKRHNMIHKAFSLSEQSLTLQSHSGTAGGLKRKAAMKTELKVFFERILDFSGTGNMADCGKQKKKKQEKKSREARFFDSNDK